MEKQGEDARTENCPPFHINRRKWSGVEEAEKWSKGKSMSGMRELIGQCGVQEK